MVRKTVSATVSLRAPGRTASRASPGNRRAALATATTNEITRNVSDASSGATEIACNITGVSGAADATTQALAQTSVAIDELSRMAVDLRTSVSTFTY